MLKFKETNYQLFPNNLILRQRLSVQPRLDQLIQSEQPYFQSNALCTELSGVRPSIWKSSSKIYQLF